MPRAIAYSEREDFDLWHEVPLVPQLTGMSCWAAAAAMIVGWRDCLDIDPEQVARGMGRWEAYRDGLEPRDIDALARAWGLHSAAPRTYTVAALRELVEGWGPLWVGEVAGGLHVVVVAGMYGDGTFDGTFVRVLDPWPEGRGERYSITFRELAENLDAVVDLTNMRARILHAGGRRAGASRSYHVEREFSATYGWEEPRHAETYPRPRFGTPYGLFQRVRELSRGAPAAFLGRAKEDGALNNGQSSLESEAVYNPRVIVKFRDDVQPPEPPLGLAAAAQALATNDWSELLLRYPGIEVERYFGSVSGEIEELLQAARENSPDYSPPNFFNYFLLTIPPNVFPEDVVAEVSAWEGVESAAIEAKPEEDPVFPLAQNPRLANQHHIDPAPVGIDARAAWAVDGGTGGDVSFIDVERGWLLGHEDLVGADVKLIGGRQIAAARPHGTAVLGVVLAQDNGDGGLGIAPAVWARVRSWVDKDGKPERGPAITAAAAALRPGDVLLLEIQSGPGPIEHEDAVFAAIELATKAGIVVVEAGGNFSTDLDAWTDPRGKFVFRRGHADFRDSGAILVGAASSTVPHTRLAFSSFGSRIDCYAWGENVDTCSTDGANATNLYVPRAGVSAFRGTSSASAIIAGVACAFQSMVKRRTQTLRTPTRDVRAILSDPANGTASSSPAADRIGVMPDLKKLVTNEILALPHILPPQLDDLAPEVRVAAYFDPGHGGRQDLGHSSALGGRGPTGTLEKDVNLSIAERALQHFGRGAMLSRRGDYNLSLRERLESARACGAPVFVSIHANHGPPERRGAEVWVYGGEERAPDAASLRLAEAIREALAPLDAVPPRVDTAKMALLDPAQHARGVAACLVEADFLSSPAGESRLSRPGSVDAIGAAIARAVHRYLGDAPC